MVGEPKHTRVGRVPIDYHLLQRGVCVLTFDSFDCLFRRIHGQRVRGRAFRLELLDQVTPVIVAAAPVQLTPVIYLANFRAPTVWFRVVVTRKAFRGAVHAPVPENAVPAFGMCNQLRFRFWCGGNNMFAEHIFSLTSAFVWSVSGLARFRARSASRSVGMHPQEGDFVVVSYVCDWLVAVFAVFADDHD